MNSMEVLYMNFGSSLTLSSLGDFSTRNAFNSSDSRVSFVCNRTAILISSLRCVFGKFPFLSLSDSLVLFFALSCGG